MLKTIIAYLLSHESLLLGLLLPLLDPDLAKQVEQNLAQYPGTTGIVIAACLIVAFLAKKYLRNMPSAPQAEAIDTLKLKNEILKQQVPGIAKGRVGSGPLSILLALFLTSLLSTLSACGDGSEGPDSCQRQLTEAKLALEACLAK